MYVVETIASVDVQTKFTSQTQPLISITNYVERLRKHFCLCDATLITALIYIDRGIANGGYIITAVEIHR